MIFAFCVRCNIKTYYIPVKILLFIGQMVLWLNGQNTFVVFNQGRGLKTQQMSPKLSALGDISKRTTL